RRARTAPRRRRARAGRHRRGDRRRDRAARGPPRRYLSSRRCGSSRRELRAPHADAVEALAGSIATGAATPRQWHDGAVPSRDPTHDLGLAPTERGTASDSAAPASERAFAETQPSSTSGDLTGTTVDRYRILGRLGAGGMGVVYAAFDPALDRKVALKMLPQLTVDHHAALEARSRLEARLRREAQALAKLDHPNVVGGFDVGLTEDNVFVTMQLVDGTTLDDYIRTTKPSPRQILGLFTAAGAGLAAAHEAGLVHRDVKPSNILVDRKGHAFIGDFGL